MNGRAARDLRKHANEVTKQTTQQLAPALQGVLDYARGTQKRVDALAAAVDLQNQNAASVLRRDLRGRFRWLFLGR
jgi:hypothetical protein